MPNAVTRIKGINIREEGNKPIDYKLLAARLNTFGKWSFAGAVLMFNVCFWAYSIFQYVD